MWGKPSYYFSDLNVVRSNLRKFLLTSMVSNYPLVNMSNTWVFLLTEISLGITTSELSKKLSRANGIIMKLRHAPQSALICLLCYFLFTPELWEPILFFNDQINEIKNHMQLNKIKNHMQFIMSTLSLSLLLLLNKKKNNSSLFSLIIMSCFTI